MSARNAYAEARRQARDRATSREDRGLPKHPANGRITCPECGGAGSFTRNDTNPCGYGPDPQCDYDVDCERCAGDGEILDGRIDLLVDLATYRKRQRHSWSSSVGIYRFLYQSTRRRAFVRCSGLAQAEMLALAAMCANEIERGVAAMRRAVAA